MSVVRRIASAALLVAGASVVPQGLPAAADPQPVTLRLGTIAPRGTTWHRRLLEMGERWRAAQGERASVIVYTDGAQGSEADMVRRMRVGQLNAGLLTVVGLTEIDESAAALQKMPLAFRSWDELDYVREKLSPVLDERFLSKGFVILCWGDAGWVRFFSKAPALHPADFRAMKLFAWAGDAAQVDIMKGLGYHPVALQIAAILPGLQTGMIDMVPSTPFWALTMQYYPHAPYMLDLKWAPMVGALVVTRQLWRTMAPAARDVLRQAGRDMGAELRALGRRENAASVELMRQRGLNVQTVDPTLEAEWRRFAEQVYPLIRGRMVPAELFDSVRRLLDEYRRRRHAAQATQGAHAP